MGYSLRGGAHGRCWASSVLIFGLLVWAGRERRRTQRALDASETEYRLLVEEVQEYAIVLLDPEGRIVTWNAGAPHLNGYQSGVPMSTNDSLPVVCLERQTAHSQAYYTQMAQIHAQCRRLHGVPAMHQRPFVQTTSIV